MSGAVAPQTILEPIASQAAAGFVTTPMPDAPTGSNAASVQGGFPVITMTEEVAGGEPPLGQDANGFFFLVSGHTYWVQAGQLYPFSAALATKMSGYKLGATVTMSDGTGAWFNTVDGNITDPDSGAAAGWVASVAQGVTVVATIGGVTVLTAEQAKYKVIRVQGALTSNAQLVVPNQIDEWLVSNETTGAFTLQVFTAAEAVGQLIPTGGLAAPIGVYCIGDGNIYPTVSPFPAATSQGPDPSTIAERTNTGDLVAERFNQAAGVEAAFTIGAVPAVNAALDNFLRLLAPLDFLAGFPGVVNARKGWLPLPGGFILNYGLQPRATGADVETFSKPFTTVALGVVTTSANVQGDTSYSALSDTQVTLHNGAGGSSTFYLALGK